MENIDLQRDELTRIDAQIKIVLAEKEQVDNATRDIERSLVEILVTQQKHLITAMSKKVATNKCKI